MIEKEDFLPWSISDSELFTYLKSSDKGLTSTEIKERLNKEGPNNLTKEKVSGFSIFISQFKNALVLVLILAAIISYFLGEKVDSIVILSIVLLNTILGFIQEYKADRALKELEKYITIKAKVLRDGNITEVNVKNLVVGDIVHLDLGDIVPADIRLLDSKDLSSDESSLTGESMPVIKKVCIINKKTALPQEINNMVFMGTSISSGYCHGIVTSIGKNTFFGKSANYVKQPYEGDFHKNINKFSNFLLKVILVMTLFIFVANTLLHKSIFDSFIFAVALAVGITPEVLPIIITISLSHGALRMAKEKVIAKRLASVEDLGNIDTLCCDKTGTLTEGKISLVDYLNVDGKKDDKLVLYGLLCNSLKEGKHKRIIGDNAIDRGIWNSIRGRELKYETKNYNIISENEFDFDRKRMSVAVKKDKNNIFIAKGAPESILKVCSDVIINNKKVKLSKDLPAKIYKKIASYEENGYRVVAIAEKPVKKINLDKNSEKDLALVGFLLFLDPPKESVKESIKLLQELGVKIKVISGDSPVINRKICNDVGLIIIEDKVITGDDLIKLNEKQFEEFSHKYNIFARVTPEQKFRIVSYLNKEGHIVGFLGDGVNDVAALKAADVGISVDSATGVAKEAASIILLNKSLKVIADGITQGRKIFGNITKYILNTISSNYGNMFTVAISSLFLKFIPLLPSQILLNNFITDAPLLTISSDNVEKSFLKKPKRWDMKLISKFMIYFGILSVIFDLALIIPLIYFFNADTKLFRTAWFVESVLTELVIIFSLRTRLPFFKDKPSKWLLISSLLAAAITIGITYTAFGYSFFDLVRIPKMIWLLIISILVVYFVSGELTKRFFFKKFEFNNGVE